MDASSPPKSSSGLAKLATIFAVLFGLSFGLCSVTVVAGDRLGRANDFLFPLYFITEAVCVIGLLGIGIAALIRYVRGEA